LCLCSKHVIFKSIDITREHHVWASTLAGAEDTPRLRYAQNQGRQPPSPHSKSLLAEWGLPWQPEVLADGEVDKEVGHDVRKILFPAMQNSPTKDAFQEGPELEALDLSGSWVAQGADWFFGREHHVVPGNAPADAAIARQSLSAQMCLCFCVFQFCM
jgi:hypothetical protein